MQENDMPAVIASRTMEVSGGAGRQVQVVIMQPVPAGNDYRCEFQIVGLGEKTINAYGMGVDSLQALILALQYISTRLYTSEEGKAGVLSWLGMRDLGFPVIDPELRPKD